MLQNKIPSRSKEHYLKGSHENIRAVLLSEKVFKEKKHHYVTSTYPSLRPESKIKQIIDKFYTLQNKQ